MSIEGRSHPSLHGFRVHTAEPRTRVVGGVVAVVVVHIMML